MNGLLRFVRNPVGSVLSGLMAQKNIVLEQAMRPMEKMVQQVVGGIWIGKGADAFVQDVRSIMMPGVRQIDGNLSTYHRNITAAIQRMDRADKEVAQLVNSKLSDAFKVF